MPAVKTLVNSTLHWGLSASCNIYEAIEKACINMPRWWQGSFADVTSYLSSWKGHLDRSCFEEQIYHYPNVRCLILFHFLGMDTF